MSDLPRLWTYALARVAIVGRELSEAVPTTLTLCQVIRVDDGTGAVKVWLMSPEEHAKVWARMADLEMIGAPMSELLAALGEGEAAIEAIIAERESRRA